MPQTLFGTEKSWEELSLLLLIGINYRGQILFLKKQYAHQDGFYLKTEIISHNKTLSINKKGFYYFQTF
ncbi:hypothetical protein CHRYSEO8AT_440151 [Chryseobacterium sp. 8AT]|nr:hypothetical protein CHRYSEO8AT_440151 [Chryseobacterium sp. 8AT]